MADPSNRSQPRNRMTGAVVRFGATAYHRLWRIVWRFWRPDMNGVRGIPITPDGRLVLVRHTYLPGWHFPGGGFKRGEEPNAAMLRELREEIGMTRHGSVTLFAEYVHRPEFWRDTLSFFTISDVEFVPRLSLEIAAIQAFALDALPPDLSPATRRRLDEWRGEAPVSDIW